MTDERRAAIGETINVIALLVEAKTPHAKALAAIVFERMLALIDGEGDPLVPGDPEIARWREAARGALRSARPH